eukprot:14067728-Alexandrium_andersonii.AAC.1
MVSHLGKDPASQDGHAAPDKAKVDDALTARGADVWEALVAGWTKPPAIEAEMGQSSTVLFQSPSAKISASARLWSH